MNYKRCNLYDIVDDAQGDKKKTEWLKREAKRKINGKQISFLALKRRYFEEFHSEDIPTPKSKQKKFWEIIDEL